MHFRRAYQNALFTTASRSQGRYLCVFGLEGGMGDEGRSGRPKLSVPEQNATAKTATSRLDSVNVVSYRFCRSSSMLQSKRRVPHEAVPRGCVTYATTRICYVNNASVTRFLAAERGGVRPSVQRTANRIKPAVDRPNTIRRGPRPYPNTSRRRTELRPSRGCA
ncbi:hypothetical protein EVAR_85852_1 [Eumeta japonica]|uniref:Uncharacterized protein n=1 Tax=Eumeta variegata TaxID=151549 RepID=A0A4C1UQB1_EUMVA|nr:hypothetical protein EVAR_85852_1 [Eumeta japonica]